MRFALLGGQDRGQVVGIRQHRIGQIAQNLRALLRQQLAPTNLGSLSGLNRSTRLGSTEARHLRNLLTRRRINDGKGLATIGIDPLTIDIGLGAEEVGIGKRQRHRDDASRPRSGLRPQLTQTATRLGAPITSACSVGEFETARTDLIDMHDGILQFVALIECNPTVENPAFKAHTGKRLRDGASRDVSICLTRS